MATISLNDTGKAVGEPIHFTLAAVDFDLADSNATYETDDDAVVSDARIHPFLKVEEAASKSADEQAAAQNKAQQESDDPHVNPAADHLRAEADPAVVEAAQQEADRFRAIAAGEKPKARRARAAASKSESTSSAPDDSKENKS